MTGWGSNFGVQNMIHAWGVLDTGFWSWNSSKFMVYCVSTMYKGSVRCWVQTARNSACGILFVSEGVVTGPWNHEEHKVYIILCKVLMFCWLLWTNELLVVEFHVFPTKVNHILTLGGLPWKVECKINTELYKIQYLVACGYKCTKLDGVYLYRAEWLETHIILWI